MSYEVIHFFTDLQDFNHPYKVGDKFPRLGMNVSEERIKELSGNNNKQGKPLIQLVEITENKYTKTEINRMSTYELKKLAKEKGIEGSENITGGELKKILIKKLCL